MAGIKFDITGDNQNFINAMNGVQKSVHQTMQDVEKSGASIENMFNRIAGAAGIAFSTATIQSFVDKILETRMYFQDIESSMEVFLGSQQKAADFTERLKKYAYYNMFEFSDLAAASKQMIAYHTAVDDVIPELDKLSNIATGTKQPLMELVNMYNNARSVGWVASQQLGMWARQGILVKETLKEMGQEVQKGGVSFEQLQMVIDKMTGEGGMFHNLMANQMENISAEAGQLEDTLALMYDELGRKYQDVFVKGYKAASAAAEDLPQTIGPALDVAASGAEFLIDHYKEIGTTLLELIKLYGIYKAALIATNAVENAKKEYTALLELKELQKEIDVYKQVLPIKEGITNADLKEAVAKGKLSEKQADLIAQKREELALLMEEQKTRISQATENVSNISSNLEEAKQRLDITAEEHLISQQNLAQAIEAKKVADERVGSAEKLVEQLHLMADAEGVAFEDMDGASDAMEELSTAITEQLAAAKEVETAAEVENSAATAFNSAETEVNTLSEQLNTAQTELNTVATGTNTASEVTNTTATTTNTVALKLQAIQLKVTTTATAIFSAALNSAKNAMNALKVAIMTNPLGVLIGALTIIVPLLMDFFGAEEDGAAANKKFGESADEATNKVKALYAVLETAKNGSKTSKDAMQELVRSYNEYGITLDETIMKGDDEKAKIDEIIAKREQLIGVIRQEAIEREAANDISSKTEDYNTNIDEVKKEIKDSIGGGWSDEAKNQLIGNFITDEYIESITKAANKYKAVIDEIQKSGGSIYGKEGSAALKEYQNAIGSVDDAIDKMASSLNLSKEDAENAKKAIKGHTQELVDHRRELNEGIDDANAARTAVLNASGALEKNTSKLLANKMSLAEIKEFLEDIAKRNKIDIDINVKYNELNPMPDALKKLNSNQWKKRAASYTAIANNMKGNKIAVTDQWTGQTKTLTKEEVLEEAARSTNAGSDKEKAEATAKRDAERAKEEAEKNKKKYAQQAAQAAQRRQKLAELDQKEREEREAQAQRTANAVADATIAAEKNAKVRERREQDRQHIIDMQRIDDQEEEYRKKNYEAMKARWEATNTDKSKTWSDTEIAKNVAKNGYGVVDLTKDQEDEIAAIRRQKETEYKRLLLDRQKEEISALREYLKEYGSYEQQRLAITEEYEEKIEEAKTEGEKKRLTKEQSEVLGNLTYGNLSKSIDWYSLFNGIGTMSKQMMQQMMGQLHLYVNSEDYRKAGAENQMRVAELMGQLREYLGSEDGTMQDLAGALTAFNNALDAYEKAQEEERKALQEQRRAYKLEQDALAQLQAGEITKEEYEQVKAALDNAKNAFDNASQAVVNARDNVQTFGSNLNRASDAVVNYTSKLDVALKNAEGILGDVAGFSELQSASSRMSALKGNIDKAEAELIAQRVSKINPSDLGITDTTNGGMLSPEAAQELAQYMASGMSTTSEKILSGISGTIEGASNFLADGFSSALGPVVSGIIAIPQIVLTVVNAVKGFVTGVLDSFTEFFRLEWISDLVDSILASLSDLIDAVLDLPESIANVLGSLIESVGGFVGNTLHRVASVFGLGGSSREEHDAEYNRSLQSLKDEYDSNTRALEENTRALKENGEYRTPDELKKVLEDAQKQAESTRRAALETAYAIADDSYDGSWYKVWSDGYHSWISEFNDSWRRSLLGPLTKTLNENGITKTLNGAGDLFGLSPDEIKLLMDSNPDEWRELFGDIGSERNPQEIKQWLETYAATNGAEMEAERAFLEQLTQISFDSLRSNFKSAILDMSKDASDFADDFKKMMADAAVEIKFNTKGADGKSFNDKLEEWQKRWGKAVESDNELTEAEIEQLRREYEALQKEALDIRDDIRRTTGYTGESSRSQQSATANGIQNISYDQADSLVGIGLASQIAQEQGNATRDLILQNIQTMQSVFGGTFNEIRNLTIQANSTRESILKEMKTRYESFDEKLTNIYRELQQA